MEETVIQDCKVLFKEKENVTENFGNNAKNVAKELPSDVPKEQGDEDVNTDTDNYYSKALEISETDGSLVKGVKLSFTSVIKRLLSIWKLSFFSRCFPQLASNNSSYLDKARMVVLQPIRQALVEDVSYIITESLLEPLKILGNLKKQSRNQKKGWRPSGDPHTDMITRDINVLQYEKYKLEKTLEKYREQSEKMKNIVLIGRRKAKENNEKLLQYGKMIIEVEDACNIIPVRDTIKMNLSLHQNIISKGAIIDF